MLPSSTEIVLTFRRIHSSCYFKVENGLRDGIFDARLVSQARHVLQMLSFYGTLVGYTSAVKA
jgi:hypothetical protein